jgi:hypothetical protein
VVDEFIGMHALIEHLFRHERSQAREIDAAKVERDGLVRMGVALLVLDLLTERTQYAWLDHLLVLTMRSRYSERADS